MVTPKLTFATTETILFIFCDQKIYSVSSKDWQVKYTVIGFLIPPLANRIEVTDRLILKREEKLERFGNRRVWATDAYVRVTTEDDSKDSEIFRKAEDYLIQFLELFTLETGNKVRIYRRGIAVPLSDSRLGEARGGDAEISGMGVFKAEEEKRLWYIIDDIKWIFDKLHQYLERKENQYLRLALSYYHRAILTEKTEEALVDLLIAAEALFYTGPNSHRKEISERLGKLAASKDNIEEIIQRTKKLYDRRSAVVHGGITSIPMRDISYLFRDIRSALKNFILVCATMKREEIIELIESQELGPHLEKAHKKLHRERKPSLRMEYRQPSMNKKILYAPWIIIHNDGSGRAVSVRLEVTTKKGVQTYGPNDINPGGWWRIPLSNISSLKLDKKGETITVKAASQDVLFRDYNWRQEIEVPPISDELWNRLKQKGKI